MFYDARKKAHGLAVDPFKSLVVPRPIGWISSQDNEGNINLAPYSYFNAICDDPAMVMFATVNSRTDGTLKDTIHNVETQGEFVVNMATYALREAVNLSSAVWKDRFIFVPGICFEPRQSQKLYSQAA